ncbi:MAG: hypothetical protein ACM3JC_11165 [Rudaea sp.]
MLDCVVLTPKNKTLFYQTTIHIAFLVPAMAIAAVDRIAPTPPHLRDMNRDDH